MSPLNRLNRHHQERSDRSHIRRLAWRRRILSGTAVVRQRWHNAMPKFFRVICWVCALVSGTALAVNTAIVAGGGVPHTWWSDIYPYLLGIPAGAAFVCKFTQQYSGKPIDIDHMHADSPDIGDEIPSDDQSESRQHEIEPYDD